MKKKWLYSITLIVVIVIAVTACKFIFFKESEKSTIQQNQKEIKQEEKETKQKDITESNEETLKEKGYLSITYTCSDPSVKTGRMMNFYTYDLESGKLDNRAQIPFDSQYALGVISLSDQKIFYSGAAKKKKGGVRQSSDHLCQYDLLNGKTSELEQENCAYNDIVPIGNGKLLVTAIPVHAIGTGIFDLNTKKFSYLYEQSKNEDGYIDFPYTTRPVKLNYNYNYKTFINTYVLEKHLYSYGVRSGKKPLKYRIALVDNELNIKNECIFNLSLFYGDIGAVAQTSSDSAILILYLENSMKQEFYKVDFSKQTCKKMKSPFSGMSYIYSLITIDDGKSYYIKGIHKDGRSGLFYYDCSNDKATPILLDDSEKENHIVNFCFVAN